MPRPPKDPEKLRRERRFYMTDAEWRLVEEAAARLNLSASRFIAEAAIKAAAKVAKQDAEEREAARRRRR